MRRPTVLTAIVVVAACLVGAGGTAAVLAFVPRDRPGVTVGIDPITVSAPTRTPSPTPTATAPRTSRPVGPKVTHTPVAPTPPLSSPTPTPPPTDSPPVTPTDEPTSTVTPLPEPTVVQPQTTQPLVPSD